MFGLVLNRVYLWVWLELCGLFEDLRIQAPLSAVDLVPVNLGCAMLGVLSCVCGIRLEIPC